MPPGPNADAEHPTNSRCDRHGGGSPEEDAGGGRQLGRAAGHGADGPKGSEAGQRCDDDSRDNLRRGRKPGSGKGRGGGDTDDQQGDETIPLLAPKTAALSQPARSR